MASFVVEIETGKKRKSVLRRINKWSILRLQPEDLISRKILVQILNAIWTAFRRNQKSQMATIWFAGESHLRGTAPSRYMDLARRLCAKHLPLIRSYGYDITIIQEEQRYVLYRSSNSRVSDEVTLAAAVVTLTKEGDAEGIKRLWSQENKLIPQEHRRKAWKRKMRRKKKVTEKK